METSNSTVIAMTINVRHETTTIIAKLHAGIIKIHVVHPPIRREGDRGEVSYAPSRYRT